MLGLQLRKEFMESRLKGTAIVFSDDKRNGSLNIKPQDFLDISYPTQDTLKCLKAIAPKDARPVVIIGERGLGKSHLMTMLYHTIQSSQITKIWLKEWSKKLKQPDLGELKLREDMHVIGVSLHRQDYNFLWDILFRHHPRGDHYKGKWEGLGDSKSGVPPMELIVQMLSEQPTALLLDECQTWYNALTNSKQYPWKNWAFNFIQILSEIASAYPDLLVLVVSLRNGDNEVYQQIRRNNPIHIDFKAGGSPEKIQRDRRGMLLHRLFENRLTIDKADIRELLDVHINEFFRLQEILPTEQEKLRNEFLESWPFAPHLLQFLEDQVLIAVDAQGTRDLIRILANLYKSRGKDNAILTAADFRLDDEKSGIGALLDAVAIDLHRSLREKAQRNLKSVEDSFSSQTNKVEHLGGILASLWLHSISLEKEVGAKPETLQVDITKDVAIDDNAFREELNFIVESSFNIHESDSRLIFKEDENPQAMVMAHAKNDRLFTDGSDFNQLSIEIQKVIAGTTELTGHRVIVLPRDWLNSPWTEFDESMNPKNWDERLPILVIPIVPENFDSTIGMWIKQHVPKNRNTIRFLLPKDEIEDGIFNRKYLILARAILKSSEFSEDSSKYFQLGKKYQQELQSDLRELFNRFAILNRWNFGDPSKCEFSIENFREEKVSIPSMIETKISNDLFVPEDFNKFIKGSAKNQKSIRAVLDELKEPPPQDSVCIPWLGEVALKERILKYCSTGDIEIIVGNRDTIKADPGKNSEEAWNNLKSKLTQTGRDLGEAKLGIPNPSPISEGKVEDSDSPTEVESSSEENDDQTIVPESAGGIDIGHKEEKNNLSWKQFNSPVTSALNLNGLLESWGIEQTTEVREVNLKIYSDNGSQLREVIKRLPDGVRYQLILVKGDSDGD